jgi:hypothetical protein
MVFYLGFMLFKVKYVLSLGNQHYPHYPVDMFVTKET